MVSFGDNVLGSPCASDWGVIGRVSVADASLSLSLSLWDGRSLAASPLRRGGIARRAGSDARLDYSCASRAVGRSRCSALDEGGGLAVVGLGRINRALTRACSGEA